MNKQLLENQNIQFWTLHIGGWFGIAIISFLSLNLGYNQLEWSYMEHGLLQSVLGIITSWPLRYISSKLWEVHLVIRLTLILLAVLLLAFVWSALRLQLFLALTDETGLWKDFGGWLFPSIFIFLTWTALYHGIKYYRLLQLEHRMLIERTASQREEALRRIKAESMARDAQLKMLRYQLNPHFLFNTLNSMSSLVASGQNKRAQNMILELSHFLRYSLSSDRDREVSLQDEVEAINKYLKIEQARFEDRLKVKIELADGCENCCIPSLILQPLLENAIKYAIAPAEDGGIIAIYASADASWLTVRVEDSGPGVLGLNETDNNVSKGTGVGLNNIKERLTGIYGDNYRFELDKSSLGGLLVRMQVPIKNKW